MVDTLGDALPREITRVRGVQDTYKILRQFPNCICEPQITMMETAIQDGVRALAEGDVVAMLRAYEALKEWEK